MKMNERGHGGRFWQATGRKAILATHQNIPDVKRADFNEVLESEPDYPLVIAFTATVVRTVHEYTEYGYGGTPTNPMEVLPCGWPWESAMYHHPYLLLNGKKDAEDKDLRNLVYQTYRFSGGIDNPAYKEKWAGWLYDLKNPEPVIPSKGCCFRAMGIVKSVKESVVVLHLEREGTRFVKGWERDITIMLDKGVENPEEGDKYVLKGIITPFSPTYKDLEYKAVVCEKLEEKQKS